jgi:pimeloyl-ACP methyl ester carboxylesterase
MCEPSIWTSARYTEKVVASIATAIRKFSADDAKTELILVGYSGGGVLAILVGERLEHVASVVTIAANLDTEARTQRHHYLSLTGSLNPAASTHDHPWREPHLQGAVDQIVPAVTTSRYFDRYASAQRQQFGEFTHVCCWVNQRPDILASIEKL